MGRLKISAEEGNDCMPRVNPGSETPTLQNLSQVEAQRMPFSPENELRNMSSGIMPGKENPQVRLVEDILQRLSELNEKKEIAEEKPYRKDLTPEEVRQNYDALIGQIQDWVQKLVNPWLEDCGDDAHAFLTHAKRRIVDADRFKRILREYPDLMNGLKSSEPDKVIV
ncbi:hypothetical protein FDENT_6810 [Fusarium denticulatum]|uniref:Uncharacterized protein n=1 Tax=Fusarium denticulatum TaxID=48507 RepID=A0A8H5X5P0_9HYPO|nr:hypothetical protein FDENT_6810 [Fusarium denticulatum]